jgi:Tetratricopeptide repeat.
MVDTISDKEAERWKSEGIRYATNQKFEDAIHYFEKASALNPVDEEIYFQKGLAFMNLIRYQEAVEAFEEALKLNDKDPRYWLYMGINLLFLWVGIVRLFPVLTWSLR